MANQDRRQNMLESAQLQIAELAEINPKTLARTDELSRDINFEDAVPHFQQMLDLYKDLNSRDISRLTIQQLQQINTASERVLALIRRVKDFELNQNTPGDVCRSLIEQVATAYDDVMNPLLLPLAFTATQATDYSRIEREAKGYHATMKKEAKELSEYMQVVRTDADNALTAVKEQAAEAGVSANAQIFIIDAEKHQKVAGNWQIATIVIASFTLLAAIAALVTAFLYQPPNTASAIQYIVAKLLVLSTLSFGVFWCARNYKAHKHNQTLNKHRANALATFSAFVEGTSEMRVKDAILLQAAQAAFSGRPTGFDGPDKESQTINPVVEILGKAMYQTPDGTG